MKQPYPHILHSLLCEPWLIRPEMLHNIYRAVAFHERVAALPMKDDDEEDDDEECRVEKGVAVIPIMGILGKHLSMMEAMCGGVDVDSISNAITAANNNAKAGAMVLHIDSPGGRVTGIPELAEQIHASAKPIVAFTDGTAASGALWIASAAHRFVASPSSEVGSVGAYILRLDESRRLENDGLKVHALVSGERKLDGAPFKPMSDAEAAELQTRVDQIGAQFRAALVEYRPGIKADDMEGQMFDAATARAKGFVDGVRNNLSEAITQASTLILQQG